MLILRDKLVNIPNYLSKNKKIFQNNVKNNMINNNGVFASFFQQIQNYKYFCKYKNETFILSFKNFKCILDTGYQGTLKIQKNLLVGYWENKKPWLYSKFLFINNYNEIKFYNSDGTVINGFLLKNEKINSKIITNKNIKNKINQKKLYLIVAAYNIDEKYIFDFLENNKQCFLIYKNILSVYIISNKVLTLPNYKFKINLLTYPEKQQIFSIGKTINYVIRQLNFLNENDLIIKTDIDIFFSKELLNYLLQNVKVDYGIVAVPHYINKEDLFKTKYSTYWIKCKKDLESKGACFALTKHDWFKICGYDERIYGWGADDTELFFRCKKRLNQIIVSAKFPLYHINHPSRINNNFTYNYHNNKKYLELLDWNNEDWGLLKKQITLNKPVNISNLKTNSTKIDILADYLCKISNIKSNDYSRYEKMLSYINTYTKKVSIVIPTYNRRQLLEIHLQALINQTYPHNLVEVVIADDGSSDRTKYFIENKNFPFNIKYVYQKDLGYRLAKIRNEAIKIASNEIIIISDVDMIPVKDYVEQHMKWHHICDVCCVIGHRRYVDSKYMILNEIKKDPNYLDFIPDTVHKRLNIKQDWRLDHYKKSNFLKNHLEPWRYLCGGNISLKKEHFFYVGLFDEDFKFWGGEDQEFAYRLFKHGVYLIPDLKATALHVEHPVNIKQQKENQQKARKLLNDKIREFNKKKFYDPPLVTIYIPVYNREKFLKKTILSAINQNFDNYEILICDDGSQDKSLEIIRSFMKQYNIPGKRPLIRCIVKNKNRGIANTWNECFRNAKGKYLLQLDGDDYIEKDTLKYLCPKMDDDIAIVFAGYIKVDINGRKLNKKYLGHFDEKTLFYEGLCITDPRLFNKKYYFYTEGCNENYINAVDYDLIAKVAHYGKIIKVNKILYYYTQHQTQTTVLHSKEQKKNHQNVINYCKNWNKRYKKFYFVED